MIILYMGYFGKVLYIYIYIYIYMYICLMCIYIYVYTNCIDCLLIASVLCCATSLGVSKPATLRKAAAPKSKTSAAKPCIANRKWPLGD